MVHSLSIDVKTPVAMSPGRLDFVLAPNICGPLVRKLLPVTLLAPKILKWLLVFYGKFVYP